MNDKRLTMNKEALQKYLVPGLGALFGLAAILILGTVFLLPQEGKEIEPEKNSANGTVLDNTELRLSALEEQMKTTSENIRKIYSNQVKLNDTVGKLIKTDEAHIKTIKENRAYIAMIYQRILDVELQVSALGGGFNRQPKRTEEQINPLIGLDELPAAPPVPEPPTAPSGGRLP
jgi:hypothetical protein